MILALYVTFRGNYDERISDQYFGQRNYQQIHTGLTSTRPEFWDESDTMIFFNLLAYIGPEVIMPLMSILAAILGGILFGWHWIVGYLSNGFRWILGRPTKEDVAVAPPKQDHDQP